MYKKERKRCFIGIGMCVVAFLVGLLCLEFISKLEQPPLGNTFYIIIGCSMMVFSLFGIYLLIKHLKYLSKTEKRRKNNPVLFLDDEKRKKR